MAQTKKTSTAKKSGGSKAAAAKKTGKGSTAKKTTKTKKIEEPIMPPDLQHLPSAGKCVLLFSCFWLCL